MNRVAEVVSVVEVDVLVEEVVIVIVFSMGLCVVEVDFVVIVVGLLAVVEVDVKLVVAFIDDVANDAGKIVDEIEEDSSAHGFCSVFTHRHADSSK